MPRQTINVLFIQNVIIFIIMMIHFHVVPCCVVGLIVYVEEEDITSWFNAASDDDEATHDKISVIHKSATSIEVTFSSGMFGLVL